MESGKAPFSAPMTVEQVAQRFGVNGRTVRQWHNTGLIPALEGGGRGRQLLFDPDVIRSFQPPGRGRKAATSSTSVESGAVIGAACRDLRSWPTSDLEAFILECTRVMAASGSPVAGSPGVDIEGLLAAVIAPVGVGLARRRWRSLVGIRGRRLLGRTYTQLEAELKVSSKTIKVHERIWQTRAWPRLADVDDADLYALEQIPYRGARRRAIRPLTAHHVRAQEELQRDLAERDEEWGEADDELVDYDTEETDYGDDWAQNLLEEAAADWEAIKTGRPLASQPQPCRCSTAARLVDAEADAYASSVPASHLVFDSPGDTPALDVFTCPRTHAVWHKDWPNAGPSSWGPTRLRRVAGKGTQA